MMYACVPSIGFKADKIYACEPMGLFDNLKEAVECINNLHNSFGYCIYPVDPKVIRDIKVTGGMLGDRKRSGYLVIGESINSYSTEFHIKKKRLQ